MAETKLWTPLEACLEEAKNAKAKVVAAQYALQHVVDVIEAHRRRPADDDDGQGPRLHVVADQDRDMSDPLYGEADARLARARAELEAFDRVLRPLLASDPTGG